MSAILILKGGSHVKVTDDWETIVDDLEAAEHAFHHFSTDGTYPNDPWISVRVSAILAVLHAMPSDATN